MKLFSISILLVAASLGNASASLSIVLRENADDLQISVSGSIDADAFTSVRNDR